jgi:hypothetical protein
LGDTNGITSRPRYKLRPPRLVCRHDVRRRIIPPPTQRTRPTACALLLILRLLGSRTRRPKSIDPIPRAPLGRHRVTPVLHPAGASPVRRGELESYGSTIVGFLTPCLAVSGKKERGSRATERGRRVPPACWYQYAYGSWGVVVDRVRLPSRRHGTSRLV